MNNLFSVQKSIKALCDMEILKLIGTYKSKSGQRLNEKVFYLDVYPVRKEKVESENLNH